MLSPKGFFSIYSVGIWLFRGLIKIKKSEAGLALALALALTLDSFLCRYASGIELIEEDSMETHVGGKRNGRIAYVEEAFGNEFQESGRGFWQIF